MAYTTIDDPSAYFQIALWSGNDSTQTITNDGNSDMQPDWVWIKRRTGSAINHLLYDSSRGATKNLSSNTTDAEGTRSTGLTGFNSDGFDLGAGGGENSSGNTFVGWQWKANGGSTTSFSESGNNPGGDRQANTTAGFSIIDYVGTGGVGTIAHGLGKVPEFIIFKDRSSDGDNWFVYHVATGNDGGVRLDTTDADGDDSNRFNDTSPTTSVFTVGASGGVNDDGKATIAYCFAPIQGYSKFGSYTGNANDDGPFLYTGFKPKFAIFKATSASGEGWAIRDSARDPFNQMSGKISANTNAAEGTIADDNDCDFLSNGIKLRSNDNQMNKTGTTFIYIAFAEHPFVSSKGVPVTAR